MRPHRRPALLCFAAITAVATSTAPLRGQTPAATRTIDILAIGPDGTPLTNLQSQDLMVRIDGRVHPVVDLRLVQQRSEPMVLPPPYGSNRDAGGRDIAVAIDVTRLQTTDRQRVTDVINAIQGVVDRRDRISVIALAEDGFSTDYTSRPEIVRAIAAKVPATGEPLQDTKTQERAAVASLSLLERRATILGVNPGHKVLVFLAPPFAATSATRREIRALAAATARQRIQLNIIEARSGPAASTGLQALAAATGGTVTPITADLAKSLATHLGPSSGHYEVRITLTGDEQDDKLHRLQVVSTRKEIQVTAPAQIYIPRNASAIDPLAALTDMLRQPRRWNDLPLRLAVFPVLDVERDRLRLLVLGEPEEQMLPLAWAQFALIAPSGAVVAEWKAEGPDLATRPIMTAVLAEIGPYRLRMAASELSGRRGAVDVEFDSRLIPAGGLNLGPLMFGGIANQAFMPVLQFPASATSVMAYAEIYGRLAATDTLAAKFEVSATADGPPVARVDAAIRTTPNDDRRAAVGTIDLTALAPGDYQVRGIVSLNGKEIGRVMRTLRKVAQ